MLWKSTKRPLAPTTTVQHFLWAAGRSTVLAVLAGDEEPLNIDCSREVQAPHKCSVDACASVLRGVVGSNDIK